MSNSLAVLVSGATGQQGGAVARALLGRGHRVRALTRRPDSAAGAALSALGADVVAADFDDPDSLGRAAADVDGVFVMGTPFGTDPDTETRQAIALIESARAAGAAHLVYSSVASALDHTGIPHFESKALVEKHLAGVDTPHTVVAPAAFLGDLTSPWLAAGLREGTYGFALPADTPLQQVAMTDLANFVATVVEDRQRFDGGRVEIASTEATGAEVAARLTAALGREIRYVETPIEVVREQMGEDGVAMVEFFRRGGYTIDVPGLHAAYPQVPWHGIDDWVSGYDLSSLR